MEPFHVAAPESRTKEDKDINLEPPNRNVLARWDPAKGKRPVLDEAPILRPSVDEFEDTFGFIEKIRQNCELYGICRIIPPKDWSPTCRLKEKSIWEGKKFPTRIQNIDLLQNREPMNKKKKKPNRRKRRRRRNPRMVISPETTKGNFGFRSSSQFSLEEFQKYAKLFKDSYFERKGAKWPPSLEEIEGEYWRIVENPTDEVEVYYGAGLENQVLGSGFYNGTEEMVTKESDMARYYMASSWNLNNLPRGSGSVLSFEDSEISGVLVPWLYVGMCFSSFCWALTGVRRIAEC